MSSVTYDQYDDVTCIGDRPSGSDRAEIFIYGCVCFYNTQMGRDCGPAYISPSGHIAFRSHRKLHRIDGPATIYADGVKEYWIDGKQLNELEFFAMYGVM